MLHVTYFSGNVTMILCFFPTSSFFSPVAYLLSWAAYRVPLAKVMPSVDVEGLFFFIRFMLIQYHACIFPLLFHIFKLWPFLPLRVWNMNLNLLFIAFACLFFFNKKKKQQTPLLMSNWIKLQWLEMCCFDIKVLWRRFRCMLAFAA